MLPDVRIEPATVRIPDERASDRASGYFSLKRGFSRSEYDNKNEFDSNDRQIRKRMSYYARQYMSNGLIDIQWSFREFSMR